MCWVALLRRWRENSALNGFIFLEAEGCLHTRGVASVGVTLKKDAVPLGAHN